jgi:uncharacterized protein YwqG
MIVSNLQNSQRIEGLHPMFGLLFSYVKTHDLLWGVLRLMVSACLLIM